MSQSTSRFMLIISTPSPSPTPWQFFSAISSTPDKSSICRGNLPKCFGSDEQ